MIIAVGAIVALPITTYRHFTNEAPDNGGSFSEAIISSPRYINPLLSQGSDADRDLTNPIYTSLSKCAPAGKLIPDLAESYSVSEDSLSYTFKIKQNTKWHDNQPLTADDVVFTINTVQNSDYNSPLRINWQGVDVTKLDDYTVLFKLKNKYAQFPNNLTLGILPRHIWSQIKPANFSLSEFNTKPIGSGPYKFSSLQKDNLGQITSYKITAFSDYLERGPHISDITFKFYPSEEKMIEAYNRGEVDSMSFVSPSNLKSVRFQSKLNVQKLNLPRYFAVFLNQNKSVILANKNVRIALNQAIDKKTLIDTVLDGNGNVIDSPMLPGILDIPASSKKYDFDLEQAKKTLTSTGWVYSEQDKVFELPAPKTTKTNPNPASTKLEFTLTTSDWPELVAAANELKVQWEKFGAKVTIKTLSLSELQQAIKDRDYDSLLFGEILNVDPDPFSFWHSSQKRDPGLNLALFDEKNADKLLEDARQTNDPAARHQKYAQFQDIVIDQAVAVFLYSSDYIYPQSKKIKNNNTTLISSPAGRFDDIVNWYIDTKRVFK